MAAQPRQAQRRRVKQQELKVEEFGQCNGMETREQRDAYIREHDLPFHPMVARGYSSIGCTHCTVAGEGRSGRWLGKPKTECGLHL